MTTHETTLFISSVNKDFEMMLKNSEVCHSCRMIGHLLKDCDMKQRCPLCHHGYVRWLCVEDPAKKSKGKLFFNCTTKGCTFYKCDEGSSSKLHDAGSSSTIHNVASSSIVHDAGSSSTVQDEGEDSLAKEESEDLTCTFKLFTRIAEERNVKISMTVEFSKGKN